MKKSIEWYEQALKNHKLSLDRKYKQLDEDTQELERSRDLYVHNMTKLIEAKRRGLKEYDDTRFMELRSKK
jgi:hypothetical protein